MRHFEGRVLLLLVDVALLEFFERQVVLVDEYFFVFLVSEFAIELLEDVVVTELECPLLQRFLYLCDPGLLIVGRLALAGVVHVVELDVLQRLKSDIVAGIRVFKVLRFEVNFDHVALEVRRLIRRNNLIVKLRYFVLILLFALFIVLLFLLVDLVHVLIARIQIRLVLLLVETRP